MTDGENEIVLKNYMEDFVEMHIHSCIKDINMCKCKYCIADVKALALNRLPPKYVVTSQGKTYAVYDANQIQYVADIITAIMSAVKIVKDHPMHDNR